MGRTFSCYPAKKDPQRLNNKMREISEKFKKFNWTVIDFPVSLKEIDKFEKQNDYGICVVTYDEREGFGVGRACEKNRIMDLLLISDKDGNIHFCHIKDINKLLTHQVANYDGKRYFCRRCLSPFRKEESLEKHLELCKDHQEGKIEMPIKGKKTILSNSKTITEDANAFCDVTTALQ